MPERLLEDFAELMSDWFWEMDQDYRFSYFSANLITATGVSPHEGIGKSRLEIALNAENREFWQAHIDDLLAKRPFRDLVYPFQRNDGAVRWFRVSGEPIFEADGTFRGYRGVGADVTAEHEAHQKLSQALEDLRQANNRLEAQNTRFGTAIDNMSLGLSMFDENFRLIVCNRRYAEMYALPEELTQPGTALEDILEYRVSSGRYHGTDPDRFLHERQVAVGRDRWESIDEFADGTVYRVSHTRIPSGGSVATHEDITARRRAEQKIAHMARHDNLTGLPNRLLLSEQLEVALERARDGDGFALLCLDLDNFKAVNDSLGHPAGDALLQAVTRRLQVCVRDTDMIARLGGDEFAILQSSCQGPESASILARRIIEVLSAAFTLDGQQVLVGASIGIALAPDHGEVAEQLLKHADLALYRAKDAGRRAYRFFETEMESRLRNRRELEVDLRQAMVTGEFEIFYQPIVSLATGHISGVEALLRWRHPREGLKLPGSFVPLCEEIGLIVPLGDWVVRQACRDVAWLSDHLGIAINLSSVQFKQHGIVSTVTQALSHANLDPARLELEITESVLLLESEETLDALHQLRDIGVRISMDDFGTGYSSLSYLRRFPFDRIKIDRSFIQGVEAQADCRAIIRAVSSLGTDLGIDTTAEGVETKEQLRALIDEGVTEVQGFLFSRPVPLDEIRTLLVNSGDMVGAAA
ncbi:putative bifunctional diguanylate cyclase/phosphodiesterase [Microbaculum marinum]|uniref:EAL domain-containing protein n=1 Tax=Microbaculum marinum TaxID=1764581 RepID=A0AAW9RC65_9HYPH